MYMLNMVIILIVMYCNVVTAIDKMPTYLLRFNNGGSKGKEPCRDTMVSRAAARTSSSESVWIVG